MRKKSSSLPEAVEDFYQLLSLPRNASIEQIKARCLELGERYKPGQESTPEEKKVFETLERAYETLIDPNLRKQYDTALYAKKVPTKDVWLIFGGAFLVIMVFLSFRSGGNGVSATQQPSEIDICIRKGIAFHREMGSYPLFRDGRKTENVVTDRCIRTGGIAYRQFP